jgi:hypothetical protein
MAITETSPDVTSEQKRPARTFVVLFAALAALAMGANMLLDMKGLFGTGIVEQACWVGRNDKMDAYRRLNTKPQVIVLGSSSANTLDPACASELTGQSAFNFAFDAGTFVDYLPVLRFIESSGDARVKRFVVGIDYASFWGGKPRRIVYSRLRRFLTPWQRVRFVAPFLPKELLDTKAIYVALFDRAECQTPKPRDDGGIEAEDVHPTPEELIEQSRFDEADEANHLRDDFDRLDDERTADLENFLVAAKADRIEVDIYVQPIHPEYLRLMQHDYLGQRYAEMIELLHDLQRRGLLHYHDTRTIADIRGDESDFKDPQHLGSLGSKRLLLTIFGKTHGCGIDLR